jgi:tetrahydromethanopterin S-methyltransferase subunit C
VWHGIDPLLHDPAIIGMCSLGEGAVAVVVGNRPADQIPELAAQIAVLLEASCS